MIKPRRNRQDPEIREFILRHVAEYPSSIVTLTAATFSVTRTTAHRYVARLLDDELLTATGQKKARRYSLKTLASDIFRITLFAGLPEDHIWRARVYPYLEGLPNNIISLCRYGFTEMLNNAVDHSASTDCVISVHRTYADVSLWIIDHGVGIFEKIRADFGLLDARSALLELSKGKLTSDRKRHSGEGIYFTSRMFNAFAINSGSLFYNRNLQDDEEWLIETGDRAKPRTGTGIFLRINTNADWTPDSVFRKYLGDTIGFRKTHFPVKLGLYPDDELVSRSQAKRVLARFEDFSEVLLDFEGVPTIGQPFADEIFRVFANEHPGLRIAVTATKPTVQRMIDHVLASADIQDAQDAQGELSLPIPPALPRR